MEQEEQEPDLEFIGDQTTGAHIGVYLAGEYAGTVYRDGEAITADGRELGHHPSVGAAVTALVTTASTG